MERKTAEVEFRKDLVLRAAQELFAERAVDRVSMDDIAAAADYTRRTLYNYFESFDEICLSLYLQCQVTRWAMQKAAIAEVDTGLARLNTWAGTLASYRRDNPHFGRLEAYWDYHGVDGGRVSRELFARFEEINEELADGLREIFGLGIADGTIRSDLDVDLCISHFLHSFRAILQRAESSAYSFARFDRDTYVDHYLDLFNRSIRPEGVRT